MLALLDKWIESMSINLNIHRPNEQRTKNPSILIVAIQRTIRRFEKKLLIGRTNLNRLSSSESRSTMKSFCLRRSRRTSSRRISSAASLGSWRSFRRRCRSRLSFGFSASLRWHSSFDLLFINAKTFFDVTIVCRSSARAHFPSEGEVENGEEPRRRISFRLDRRNRSTRISSSRISRVERSNLLCLRLRLRLSLSARHIRRFFPSVPSPLDDGLVLSKCLSIDPFRSNRFAPLDLRSKATKAKGLSIEPLLPFRLSHWIRRRRTIRLNIFSMCSSILSHSPFFRCDRRDIRSSSLRISSSNQRWILSVDAVRSTFLWSSSLPRDESTLVLRLLFTRIGTAAKIFFCNSTTFLSNSTISNRRRSTDFFFKHRNKFFFHFTLLFSSLLSSDLFYSVEILRRWIRSFASHFMSIAGSVALEDWINSSPITPLGSSIRFPAFLLRCYSLENIFNASLLRFFFLFSINIRTTSIQLPLTTAKSLSVTFDSNRNGSTSQWPANSNSRATRFGQRSSPMSTTDRNDWHGRDRWTGFDWIHRQTRLVSANWSWKWSETMWIVAKASTSYRLLVQLNCLPSRDIFFSLSPPNRHFHLTMFRLVRRGMSHSAILSAQSNLEGKRSTCQTNRSRSNVEGATNGSRSTSNSDRFAAIESTHSPSPYNEKVEEKSEDYPFPFHLSTPAPDQIKMMTDLRKRNRDILASTTALVVTTKTYSDKHFSNYITTELSLAFFIGASLAVGLLLVVSLVWLIRRKRKLQFQK